MTEPIKIDPYTDVMKSLRNSKQQYMFLSSMVYEGTKTPMYDPGELQDAYFKLNNAYLELLMVLDRGDKE